MFNFGIAESEVYMPSAIQTASTWLSKALAIPTCASVLMLNDTSGLTAVDAKLGTNATYNSSGVTLADLNGPGASFGKVAKFDGSAGYVQLPSAALNSVFDPTKGTIGIWANLNELWNAANFGYPVEIGADTNNRVLITKNSGGGVIFDFIRGGTVTTVSVGSPSSGWHNFAVTWDTIANQFKAFIDAVQQGTTQTIGGSWTGSLSDTWSQIGQQGANRWPGWLTGFTLYTSARPQADITTLATAI